MPKRIGSGIVLLLLIFLGGLAVRADVLTLRDGKTVEGAVFLYNGEYRVRLADGTSRTFPASSVSSVLRSSTTAPSAGGSFNATRTRAEAQDVPVLAMTLWEKFIDANPSSPDLPKAREQLERWRTLHEDGAERINGKWVSGADRKRILAEVDKLCSEAREQLQNQTLQAIEKYEKALKLYPNCFEANFALGYYYLSKGAGGAGARGNNQELDKAIISLQAAVRLRPQSPEALSNLAVGYSFRGRFEESITSAFQAAKIKDNRLIVENLVNALARSPERLRQTNSRVKEIMPQATLLARKYEINPQGTGQFRYIAPMRTDGVREGATGIVGNGSAFLVSADGYIITNRHVVEGKDLIFRIKLEDGTEKPATVVAVDPELDIALLKIKHDAPLPYLKLAKADLPNPGAPCMVLGYPIAAQLDFQMQVTSGEISATAPGDEYQVVLIANTTHGNSGGPIVDRDGNVIGILSAGTSAYNATYLRAVSAGQIRGFLDKVKDKHAAKVESVEPQNTPFDGEKLAAEARKSTLIVLIIRGDGKDGTN